MNSLKNIGIVTIILGALVTLGIMASTASSVESLSDFLIALGFYLWVMLPFVVLLILTFFIHRKDFSPAARIAVLLTSILVVASSVLIYWASIFESDSSTSALVFVIIPLYALAAIAILFLLAWLVMKLFMPKSHP
jgi:drug/metabolite transporter (DMT)-like permease